MEKLLAALNVSEDGFRDVADKLMQRCDLRANESFPADVPKGTWIFIESGFIKQSFHRKAFLDTDILLPEGTCLILTMPSAGVEGPEGVTITAIEPTTLYYLSEEQVDILTSQFHTFGWNHFSITMQAGENLRKRSEIWLVPSTERVAFVKREYPFLLRVSPGILADYLRLTGTEHTELLATFN